MIKRVDHSSGIYIVQVNLFHQVLGLIETAEVMSYTNNSFKSVIFEILKSSVI